MSAIDPTPNPSHSTPLPARSFTEELKRQIKDTSIALFKPLLTLVRITIIFIAAIFADEFVVEIINRSFDSLIKHNPFAALVLEGIQLLSVLGTAAGYIL